MSKAVYEFVDPADVKVPEKALIWTQLLYCDKTGWYSLPENEKLEPRVTKFEDNRLMFLDCISSVPDDIQKMISGDYDVKCWGKNNSFVCIEAEKSVYIKLSNINTVVTYHHPTRLPTFTKAWKPILFLINDTIFTLRVSEEIAIILVRADKNSTTINVYTVDYNKGFCCSHPIHTYGIVYGSYIVENLNNCIEIPNMECLKGPWGFYVQFFTWGGLVIPKEIEYSTPSNVLTSFINPHKSDKIGTLFYPPNIFLHIHIDGPTKINRILIYGKDYVITARKDSETDINIYLLMDGQLAVYNFSFDVRINKPNNPKISKQIKFKAIKSEKDDKTSKKLSFKATKEITIPIQSGSPTDTDLGHLLSEQVVAIFDAETSQYFSHPPGLANCPAFKKLGVPVSN